MGNVVGDGSPQRRCRQPPMCCLVGEDASDARWAFVRRCRETTACADAIIGRAAMNGHGSGVGDISQHRSQRNDRTDALITTIAKYLFNKVSPPHVRLIPVNKNHIDSWVANSGASYRDLRPHNVATGILVVDDVWSVKLEVVELLPVDFAYEGRIADFSQMLECFRRNICSITPTRKSGDENRQRLSLSKPEMRGERVNLTPRIVSVTMARIPAPRSSNVDSNGRACICFDMDGLLVNTEPMWWHSEAALMREYGGEWTDDDGRACVGGPLEKVADVIITRTGKGDPETIIDDLINRMAIKLSTESIALMPGAADLMRSLHADGARLALVSASPRVLVDAVLSNIGDLAALFEFSISCDDVTVSKPDPAPYLLAARSFDVPAEEMVVLEDSPTGVAAAIAARARVIAVPHLVAIPAQENVTVVASLAEIDASVVVSLASGGTKQVGNDQ